MKIKESDSSFLSKLLLLLMFPFFAFSQSVRKIHKRDHFWIVLLFAVFFAYTFIPIPNSDATRFEERLTKVGNYSLNQYFQDIQGMYSGRGLYEDAYIYTIQLFISPISNSIKVYRVVFGFIYFYVFLSLIRIIQSNALLETKKKNWFLLGLVFLISFTAGINGVRWPLASMVFFLFVYYYLLNPSTKNLILVILPIFIHFSFYYTTIFFIIYTVTRRFYSKNIAVFLFFIIFILSTNINNGFVNNSNFIGEGIDEKITSYSATSYREQRLSAHGQLNWYVQFSRTIPNYFVLISVLLTTYFGRSIRKSYLTESLQYLTLLLFASSFLSAQIVDQTSNRFIIVASGIGYIYLYHLYNENSNNRLVKTLFFLYFPILILTVLVQFRSDLYCVSPNLLIGNIFTELIYSFDSGIETIIGL